MEDLLIDVNIAIDLRRARLHRRRGGGQQGCPALYALMVGVPARQIGWMSEHGEQLDLPLMGNGEADCPATGKSYILREGRVITGEAPHGD